MISDSGLLFGPPQPSPGCHVGNTGWNTTVQGSSLYNW